MKKKSIVNLIRYHAEKNETAFRDEAYAIANDFDASGDYQLAEYIMALMSDANVLFTQSLSYESKYLEKVEINNIPLFLPDVISQDILGIANAINNKADVNRFLFAGAAGTGKTEAVKQLAKLLERDIFMVDFSSIIDSKLGQTQKNISELFKEINSFNMREKVIFLFDEIDALALDRTNSNDLREMGRATSTLLKCLDNLSPKAIIVATTNLYDKFDNAVLRRFDYTIDFNRYDREDLIQVAENLLDNYLLKQKGMGKNVRLFKKIISLYETIPCPGELKNIIKTAIVFSNTADGMNYFKRLYQSVAGCVPSDTKYLQNQGFTVREIEILTGISKSSVARDLKED